MTLISVFFVGVSITFARNVLWNSTEKAHDATYAMSKRTALSMSRENSSRERKWKKRRERPRQARVPGKIDEIKIIYV